MRSYGDRVALVDYVKPGFDLAQAAARVYEAHPGIEGMILRQHGIFSFGATAQESYERMVDLVTLAEEKIAAADRKPFRSVALPAPASLGDVAPVVRGLLAQRGDDPDADPVRLILEFRTSDAVLNYVNGTQVRRYSQVGVVTPDHAIRTKNWPLVLPPPAAGDVSAFKGGGRQGRGPVCQRLPHLLQAPRWGPRAAQDPARPHAAGVAGAGAGAVRGGEVGQRRPHRRRHRREHGARHHRRRGTGQVPAGVRGRHVRS